MNVSCSPSPIIPHGILFHSERPVRNDTTKIHIFLKPSTQKLQIIANHVVDVSNFRKHSLGDYCTRRAVRGVALHKGFTRNPRRLEITGVRESGVQFSCLFGNIFEERNDVGGMRGYPIKRERNTGLELEVGVRVEMLRASEGDRLFICPVFSTARFAKGGVGLVQRRCFSLLFCADHVNSLFRRRVKI